MAEKQLTHLQTPDDGFVVEYPELMDILKRQAETYWIFDETNPEKDKHDMMVNMTEAERHGVVTTLKTFTLLEKLISYGWSGIAERFPRDADVIPLAKLIESIESATHMPFYRTINETLGIATKDFYNEYKYDPLLKERIDSIHNTLSLNDDLRYLSAFSFLEGAILFSSFAFLKGFQLNGRNLIVNIVAGINFSCRDELLHCDAASYLYRTLKKQQLEAGIIDDAYVAELEKDIIKAGRDVYEHELLLLDKLFEKGDIEGMHKDHIAAFVRHRVNACLIKLDIDPIYDETFNPIAHDFYASITGYSSTDFFSSQGNQYSRGWNKSDFDLTGMGDKYAK